MLASGDTLVGRGDECILQLDDPAISRQHIRVTRLDGNITVTDLGSSNGTFVNGELVLGTQPLHIGDELKLGKSTLLLGGKEQIESVVPPGIEILEQERAVPSQAEVTTEPEVSTIAVLESLVRRRESAEKPTELAWMIRRSVDHLLATALVRDLRLGPELVGRIDAVLAEIQAWECDAAIASWVSETRRRLAEQFR